MVPFIVMTVYNIIIHVQKFADKNGMAFFEVSAKDGTNVELVVTNMVARIWRIMIQQNSSSVT